MNDFFKINNQLYLLFSWLSYTCILGDNEEYVLIFRFPYRELVITSQDIEDFDEMKIECL